MSEFRPLTPTQEKVMRMVGRSLNLCRQISGNGMAPYMSAARALERQGLLGRCQYGYFLTACGRHVAKDLIEAYEAQKAAKEIKNHDQSREVRQEQL
jgi:hypothetical protein